MRQSRLKRITIKDLFYFYRFKKNIDTFGKTTIPDPYVKQKDVSDNKYALDYNVWKKLIEDHIDCVGEVLISGNKIKLPFFMGDLSLRKVKIKRLFDRKKSSEEQKQIYRNVGDYENYVLKLQWDRDYKTSKLTFKWHWKLKPALELLKRAYKECDNDYTYIQIFPDKK